MKKQNNLKVIITLVGIFGLTTVYNNCADVNFKEASSLDSIKEVPPDDIDTAIKTCDEAASKGQLQTLKHTLTFQDTRVESGRAKVCLFKDGPATDLVPDALGNLTKRDGYLRARYEQEAEIQLPANAVVCGADFKAPEQQFYYDDVIYFTFNGQILTTNLKKSLSRADKVTYMVKGNPVDVYLYDWSKFADEHFASVNSKADDYCIGDGAGSGTCHWPLSQQKGKIEMAFNPEVLVPMSLATTNLVHKFGFAVTGDNDVNDDCYHQKLDLAVELFYYTKK